MFEFPGEMVKFQTKYMTHPKSKLANFEENSEKSGKIGSHPTIDEQRLVHSDGRDYLFQVVFFVHFYTFNAFFTVSGDLLLLPLPTFLARAVYIAA